MLNLHELLTTVAVEDLGAESEVSCASARRASREQDGCGDRQGRRQGSNIRTALGSRTRDTPSALAGTSGLSPHATVRQLKHVDGVG